MPSTAAAPAKKHVHLPVEIVKIILQYHTQSQTVLHVELDVRFRSKIQEVTSDILCLLGLPLPTINMATLTLKLRSAQHASLTCLYQIFCGARIGEQIDSKTMLEKLLPDDDQRIVFLSNTTSLTEEVAKMKKRSYDITIDTQNLNIKHVAPAIDARGLSVLAEHIADIPGPETVYYMPVVAYPGSGLPMEVVAGHQIRFSEEEKERLLQEEKLSVEWSRD
jgi:hypothetical protein